MRKKLVSVFLLFTAVSLACSFVTNLTHTGNTTTVTPLAPNAQAEGFSAESTAAGSVLLKWEPISSAEKYLIEVQVGDEFIPLVTLSSDQRSYEAANVPPATRFTYRLSSLANSKRGNSKEIMVETPQVVSNPLRVSLEFDQSPAALTIDPKNFDPSSIDPNNFDPSMYMAQPIQTKAKIGPQGGEISVTGSNGVIYTLSVPPNALRFEVPITLKPISSIPDLPLSGGLMAAVFIAPASLVFDIPTTLKMTPPADFPAATGPLMMAFAFETNGQEFHLFPLEAAAGQSRVGAHLASLQAFPDFLPPLSDIAKLRYGGGYGQGSGKAEDVKAIGEEQSSKSQNRTEQYLAMSQLEDELTPLTSIDNGLTPLPSLATFGEAILQKTSKIDDWSKFVEVVDSFISYLTYGGDKYTQLNDKIFDLLADKTQALLKKNKGDCLTKDDILAQEIVSQLTNPQSIFSKALAERFKQKYGQKLLDDLANAKKACAYTISMESKITAKGLGNGLTITASTDFIPLHLGYSKGDIYLSGDGIMHEQVKFDPDGPCGTFPIVQYPELDFYVDYLTPVFENGVVHDFYLPAPEVKGWDNFKGTSAAGQVCPEMLSLAGGGDYWTGLFTLARISNSPIQGWKVQGNLAEGNTLTADWQSVTTPFSPLAAKEIIITEDTKFELMVTKHAN